MSSMSERQSRLRSGSLTLPQTVSNNSLSAAFGPSLFSSNWGPGTGGLSTLDSLGSNLDSDDFDAHHVPHAHTTLDYLGLDDGHRTATLSELRAQTQAAITNNIPATSRTRASTVSNPYPRLRGNLLPAPGVEDDEDLSLYEEYQPQPQPGPFGRPRAESHAAQLGGEGYFPMGVSRGGYKQDSLLAPTPPSSNRPRAISVGILDDPTPRTLQHRSSAADKLSQAYLNDYNAQSQYGISPVVTSSGILKSDSKLAGARPSVHFPPQEAELPRGASYLVAPQQQGRSISPTKVEAPPSSQMQTPTRSLWIGNLDSGVTSEQLIHVFAPYGAIESLRLLPEKVSARPSIR
jgi:protein JSN1